MTSILATSDDITTIEVDVIVNAANPSLAGGGGVDGAIHRTGGPLILEQCLEWVGTNGPLPTGETMITDGGCLPAAKVIHTVGPVWSQHEPEEARKLLALCYVNSLEMARDGGWRSVAFPNISTGAYGFPKRTAAEVSVESVRISTADESPLERVIFCCFNQDNLEIYEELLDP